MLLSLLYMIQKIIKNDNDRNIVLKINESIFQLQHFFFFSKDCRLSFKANDFYLGRTPDGFTNIRYYSFTMYFLYIVSAAFENNYICLSVPTRYSFLSLHLFR